MSLLTAGLHEQGPRDSDSDIHSEGILIEPPKATSQKMEWCSPGSNSIVIVITLSSVLPVLVVQLPSRYSSALTLVLRKLSKVVLVQVVCACSYPRTSSWPFNALS